MKNTKNLLITGIALAIALCTSVQVIAMDPNRKVNPYLGVDEKYALLSAIRNAGILYLDPKTKLFKQMSPQQIEAHRQRVNRLKDMYYGNQAYTMDDIANAL